MAVKMPLFDWKHEPLSESFHAFKARIELYFEDQEITEAAKQAIKIKIAIGDEGMRRILSSGLSDADKKLPGKIFSLLENQLDASVKINFRVHRLEFGQIRQNADENITDFVSRLREKAIKCDFEDDELNQRLLESLVISTPFEDFRKELLGKDKDYKIKEAIEKGREYEAILASQESIKTLYKSSNIDALKKSAYKKTFDRPCSNCNLRHPYRACPAFMDECHNCKRKGHWSKCCRSKKVPEVYTSSKSIPETIKKSSTYKQHEIAVEESDYEKVFYSINTKQCSNGEAFAIMDIEHANVTDGHLRVKIDTGAAANTLPLRTYKQMFPKIPIEMLLKPEPNIKLTSYSDTNIPCLGSITMGIKKKSQSTYHDAKLYVVNVSGPAVLGLPDCKKLKLIDIAIDTITPHGANLNSSNKINNIDDLKNLYPDRFDKIGKFKKEEKLVLKPDACPFIDPPRRCPIHIKDKIKTKLDDMVANGVIRPVSKPTQWCSSITYPTKKDGSIRVCLDPKKLNANLVKRPHKIPSVEEVTPCFANAKYFSKLDAKAGYWSVRLHESSQELTTFRTPFGRYCFNRLPFGLIISQDAYQERMDVILNRCEGVSGISDDLVVYGSTEEQHDKNLINLMNVAREEGLIFNSEKCQIKTKEITFFGRKYTDKGVFPDPDKINDINNMPTPQNKAELQKFLGMLTFLSNHLPNISNKTAILRDLIKDDIPYEWSEDHQDCFVKLKQLVANSIGLRYFDPTKKTTLEVDASMKGLGAVIIQDGAPTAFASKALTDAQSNYSNLERECLAVVFGIQRYHHFLFGKEFEVITDCKPLEMIFRKPLSCAPPRLQRIMIKVQGYDFTVKHISGRDNIIPDVLSRLPNPNSKSTIQLDKSVDNVQFQMDMMNFSIDKQSQIRIQTERDEVLSKVIQVVMNGWPANIKDLPDDLKSYWAYRDELGVSNGIIFKGNQVVIPKVLQSDILKQLHEGHQGIEKTRRLARQYVYWPNFNKDIEKNCNACSFCQRYAHQQQREPILSHEQPRKKWQKVATDLFSVNNKDYLIIADYYSRYPYVKEINSLTAKTIVKETKECFGLFGIPFEIVSDNGPCYLSEYDQMCEALDITHIKISPRHPQGNGFIERQIGSIKPCIKKCMESGSDIQLALLNIRATPIDSVLPSPAELMFGYKITTILPNKRNDSCNEDYIDHNKKIVETQKQYGDQHTKELRPLLNGENVRVLDPERKIWFKGTIIESQRDRSYKIESEAGRTIIRNRVHLRPVPSDTASSGQQADVYHKNTTPFVNTHISDPSIASQSGHKPSVEPPDTKIEVRRSTRVTKPPNRLIDEI